MVPRRIGTGLNARPVLLGGGLSGLTLRVVPVEFLIDKQAAAYGRLAGVPSRERYTAAKVEHQPTDEARRLGGGDL
jgi:hypothetical protein